MTTRDPKHYSNSISSLFLNLEKLFCFLSYNFDTVSTRSWSLDVNKGSSKQNNENHFRTREFESLPSHFPTIFKKSRFKVIMDS